MTEEVKRVAVLGGPTSQLASVIGLDRELIVDTDKRTLTVHDGETPGGFPLLREDGPGEAVTVKPDGAPYRRPQSEMAADVTNVMPYILPGLHAAIIAGTSTVDVSAALNVALAKGRDVYLPYSVAIASPLTIGVAGTRFYGPGTIKLASGFPGNEAIVITAKNVTVEGIAIDGASAVTTSSVWYSGITTVGDVSGLVIRNTRVRSTRFKGIEVRPHTARITDVTIADNRVDNVGWTGIDVTGVDGLECIRNRVRSTGYNAIACADCDGFAINHNDVSKASPPPVIYNGPGGLGGVEKGQMIWRAPNAKNGSISFNRCVDNRNAADDGIGLGEDGTTEFRNLVIHGNTVIDAGLFGIDACSYATITGNTVVRSASQGIFVGQDLGGKLRGIIIADNLLLDIGTTAGAYGIQLASNLGNDLTFSGIKITNNTVRDDRATKLTACGIGIYTTAATFDGDIEIHGNDLSRVATASLFVYGSGPTPVVRAHGNIYKDSPQVGWVPASGILDALGLQRNLELYTADGATFKGIANGYVGQVFTIRCANSGTAVPLDFDWPGSTGLGTQRIIGNVGVDYTLQSGDVLTVEYTGQYWAGTLIKHG